jgi:hypothetical protein
VGPFGLGDRTFDGNMVDLVIIVSMVPFSFKVCV